MACPVDGDSLYLTLLIFLPTAAMFVVFAAPEKAAKWIGLATLIVECLICVGVYANFNASSLIPGIGINDAGASAFQLIKRVGWIESFNIEYFVAIDQLSFWMVVLTGFVALVAGISSFSIKKNQKGYWAMFLLLNTGMYGVFCAMDFFLFYVFWEIMLLPMYFLIGIWGGPRKEYAAIKFFLYTLAGSVFLLLGMIAIYYGSDATPLAGTKYAVQEGGKWLFANAAGNSEHTFNLIYLQMLAAEGHWAQQASILGMDFTKIVWVAMFIAFAIKVPMFPFHTWLPDTHVQAPTAISAILAGILLKMGCYGILRFNFQLLPDATVWAADFMATFGMISIVYAALVCLAQTDLKKIIAYSSVSHMGFVLLGFAAMTPQSMVGGYFQMVSHGIVSPMLFLLVGVVYDRAHTRDVNSFGGLATEMPEYAALTGLAFFASLGLPGLAGFIGEALVFLGAFPKYQIFVMVSVTSVIVTAAYYLWTMQRVFLGGFNEKWKGLLPGLTLREKITLYPLAFGCIFLGVAPMFVFEKMNQGMFDLAAYTTKTATEILKVAGL
jgi:NADH-quinone oxidoreductase subunit M